MESRERALLCLKAAEDKKAIDPILLDMKGQSSLSDYVLVCSGSSDRQVKAIADSIGKELKEHNCYPIGTEGYSEGRWVLKDFGDVVVHVFYEEVREFYNIEKLWPYAVEIS